MSLQFYFGASGAGKSRKLHDYIIEESQRHPEKNYLLIVPDQFTMQTQMDLVVDAIRQRTNKPLKTLIIQQEGGTIKTVEKGVRYAQEMVQEAALLRREEFPVSELILGTNCGGSDPSSGLGSNPLVGSLSDRLVGMGATSVLCETTEFLGAEHILARRAVNKQVHDKIYDIVYRYEESLKMIWAGNPQRKSFSGSILPAV